MENGCLPRDCTPYNVADDNYFPGCIGPLMVGSIAEWSASAFPKIRSNELGFRLSVFQEAWVINTIYAGIMVGPLLAGIAMDAIGRKSTLLLFTVFAITNWTLVTFAPNKHILYLGRFCGGIWAGCVITIVPAFLAEILEPDVRGSLGSLFVMMYFAGNLYENLIGPYVTYREFCLISSVPVFVFAATFAFIPETPYYYMMKGQRKKAEASLTWLRGDGDVTVELDAIEKYAETFMKERGSFKDLIFNEEYRKAFWNVQGVYFIQKLCGTFTVLAYLTVIIPKRVGPLAPSNCTQITGIVLLLSTFSSTFLLDAVGRKPLFVISNIGIIVTTSITGAWYFLDGHTNFNMAGTTYVPFLGILLYGGFFCVGVGPIASIYQGEVLPSNIKARASTVTTMISAFASIVNTTLFAVCNRYIGIYVNFFLFALTSVFGLYFAKYHFIETKGKTLQEIQEELMMSYQKRKASALSGKPGVCQVPIPHSSKTATKR